MIRRLELGDAAGMAAAFTTAGMTREKAHFARYAHEQADGQRVVFVAFHDDRDVMGYLTVVWQPDYVGFAAAGVPEIQDLNVLPRFRRRGVATALLDRAEAEVATRSAVVGIGVGIGSDYGPAQRLYVLRGYVPDGLGAVYEDERVSPGQRVPVDDDLALHLTKALR